LSLPSNSLRTDPKEITNPLIYKGRCIATQKQTYLEIINWKRCARKMLWPNVEYYPRTYLDGLRKTTKTLKIVYLSTDIRTKDLPNKR
jgi:hypothetical protein